MNRLTERGSKRLAVAVFSALLGVPLLIILFLGILLLRIRSQDAAPVYNDLARAIERNDHKSLKELSTVKGYAKLRRAMSQYGHVRLGRYLARHKPVKPYMHAPLYSLVILSDSPPEMDAFVWFWWTWHGWRFSDLTGTPVFQRSTRVKRRARRTCLPPVYSIVG